jgi:metallo-beta-lactamase family protein
VKIGFHGAARAVTGSRHLIETKHARVLLDCGLVQGKRSEADWQNRNFGFNVRTVDAVVLSHAHIDHIGALPAMSKNGFNGPIYATAPTVELASIMLRDSAHIQEKDAKFVNKRRRRHRGQRVEPLYTQEDVEPLVPRFKKVPLHHSQEVAPGIRVTYQDAGHILGSASVLVEAEEDGHTKRILFSGDVGQSGRVIIRDPEPGPSAEVLLVESTYGDRLHDTVEDVGRALAEFVQSVVKRGGKVVIPAFSVGRSQHVVYYLGRAMREGKLDDVPIFVDSPLTVKVPDVYRRHPEWYDEDTKRALDETGDPLCFGHVRYVQSVDESKSLNEDKRPCVIIASSGMCEAGRVLHHLRNTIGDPKNAVAIVGYQAPHTLGRRLVEKREVVKIFGEPHERRAEVFTIGGLSAHADRNGLLEWVGTLNPKPEHIFLVHGDPDAQVAFRAALRKQGHRSVRAPKRGEVVTL